MKKVTAVIPFHLNQNQPYLDLCLESFLKQKHIDLQLILISDADEVPKLPSGVEGYFTRERLTFAQKINKGFQYARSDADFYFVGSDDIILGKDVLSLNADIIDNRIMTLNSLSNCDEGMTYMGQSTVTNEHGKVLNLKRVMELDEVKDHKQALMEKPGLCNISFSTIYNAMYATMMRKEVWLTVGGFDEGFENGCEDTDFDIRAKKMGVTSYQTLASFVFHFSGRTTSLLNTKEHHHKNWGLFKQKHGMSVANYLRIQEPQVD